MSDQHFKIETIRIETRLSYYDVKTRLTDLVRVDLYYFSDTSDTSPTHFDAFFRALAINPSG